MNIIKFCLRLFTIIELYKTVKNFRVIFFLQLFLDSQNALFLTRNTFLI